MIPINKTSPYRVLARKYRPQTLTELVGQDVLVKTLAQGIKANRLPHAFILYGIRGVGKTTTARIIAKALNCVGTDGKGEPTPAPCGVCSSCVAIMEDRHLDVVEMDAASRTGVDDIREVIEAARYKAVSGRYKIYIIDEVHMLSKSAFNALLKTLEEPPPHVKFIFATTELKKVPDTVLSRCMRFDLACISPKVLFDHFRSIAEKEDVSIEDEGLALLVRAADGSARDGLSLLDQAIALSDGVITTSIVRDMLGLVDRGLLFGLLASLLCGEAEKALFQVRDLFTKGGDPVVMMQELLDLTYWITCLKATPKLQHDITYPESDRRQGLEIAQKLPPSSLMRAWQVLGKGYEEVVRSPLPRQATEMVLLRLCYLSELPSAEDLLAALQGHSSRPNSLPQPQAISQSVPQQEQVIKESLVAAKETETPESPLVPSVPSTFQGVLELLSTSKEPILYSHLVHDVHLVDYKPAHMTVRLSNQAPSAFPETLRTFLTQLTKVSWVVEISQDEGAKTITEQKKEHATHQEEVSKAHPVVQAMMETFPESSIIIKKE